jgi:Ala-tRNA(Pro) deacylase
MEDVTRHERSQEMIAAMEALTELLEREGIEFERLPHRRTDSAAEEAETLGIDPHDVAKTIVVATEQGFVRAVIPASERLDVRKVRQLFALHGHPHLAHEEELAATYPSFELGAIPPIGGPAGDRVAVDRPLADHDTIVIEGGSHEESLRLRTTEVLIMAHASIGDLCHD